MTFLLSNFRQCWHKDLIQMKFARCLFWGLVLLMARSPLAEAVDLPSKLAPVAPFPTVSAAAQGAGIPLAGFGTAEPGEALLPGDSVTGLITLHEKKHGLTQWLVSFEAITNLPAAATKPSRPMVLYTSTGNRFDFTRAPASIRVRILGPFPESSPSGRPVRAFGDQSTRVSISESFLSVGLDRGAATILRWVQAAHLQGGDSFVEAFDFAPKPFDNARTNHDARLALKWHVTPEEEQAVAGWGPALDAYFNTVGQTPNLKDILWKVLSLPSVWSFIKNAGVKVDFSFDNEAVKPWEPAGWNLPGNGRTFSLPSLLTINKHPALALTLIVTSPTKPLLVCGGVVGFLAENPADEENYLTLRIISAQSRKH